MGGHHGGRMMRRAPGKRLFVASRGAGPQDRGWGRRVITVLQKKRTMQEKGNRLKKTASKATWNVTLNRNKCS